MCMNLYRKIDRTRVQFDFVKHISTKGAFEDEILALGGRIFEAPRYNIKNHFTYVKWWKHFLTENPEFQIIHAHYYTFSAVYLKIARRMGRYTIGHIHSASAGNGIAGHIKEFYIHRIPKYADARFACSKAAGEWAYGDKSFTVIKNALDTDKLAYNEWCRAEMRESLGLAMDEPMFCIVANLRKVKNPIGAMDIFKAIKTKLPCARLFWVGEGTMRAPLEEKIKAEGLSSSVTLLGSRSDIPELLQAADVFMLCSFHEGLGLSAIEAQAAGLPCLLSVGVPREANVTGLCTFLPLDDTQAWTDVAERALRIQRRDTREAIIASGYDVKRTADWLVDFYLNCK